MTPSVNNGYSPCDQRDGLGRLVVDRPYLGFVPNLLYLILAAAMSTRPQGATIPVRAIRLYQRHISKHTAQCPMRPSCSQFAIDEITTHGVARGVMHAAVRTSRHCGRPTP